MIIDETNKRGGTVDPMILLDRRTQYENLLRLVGEQRPVVPTGGATSRPARMRSIVNTHRLAEAYKPHSRVAYVSDQYPTEIVFPYDVIPWNIESMAIMLAQTVDVNRVFQLTQEREVSRDLCSFLRGPYGLMLADCYPRPNVVLSNDQPCDGLSKMLFNSGRRYEAPVLGLHSPNTIDQDSIAYLERQLEDMYTRIGEALGAPPSAEALLQSVRHSNEARGYYCKTLELLKGRKIPGVSRELQEIFGMNYFGSPANVKLCQALYQEAKERSSGPENKGRRVLWIGQVPEESHELLRYVRQAADIIFWAPLWDANTIFLDEDRPMRSLAHRAMLYHWNAERMGAELSRMVDEYAIEGFLIINVWGCRNMMGLSPLFRDIAASRKLKYLTINTDLVDRNNYHFTHVKNRVDAFLELMQ